MDPQVGASFIPKKTLTMAPRPGGGVALLVIVALLIFVASLVAAGSAFLYQQYLQKSLADKKHDLEVNVAAFAPGSIDELLRVDERITQAQTLLNKHVAVSAIFNFLSQQTLAKVSFGNFSYNLKNDGSASVTLVGLAQDFSTLALQSDQFGASKYLKNIVFTGIGIDLSQHVSFTMSADVDASLLSYANLLKGGGGLTVPDIQSAQASSSATSTPH